MRYLFTIYLCRYWPKYGGWCDGQHNVFLINVPYLRFFSCRHTGQIRIRHMRIVVAFRTFSNRLNGSKCMSSYGQSRLSVQPLEPLHCKRHCVKEKSINNIHTPNIYCSVGMHTIYYCRSSTILQNQMLRTCIFSWQMIYYNGGKMFYRYL